jgi:EAL domain-containing protein (putative c-di-GMP-specific phosphodiesterase class I)
MRFLWDMSGEGRLPQMNAMHLNLKRFGLVNQQIGRERGDLVMRRFYEGLQEIIGDGGWLARMGGDSFMLLADKQLTGDILQYLAGTPVVYDDRTGEKILISATVGVFDIPEGFMLRSESDIMDPTVSSSQAAKNSSTADVVYFDREMILKKQHMMEIQKAFADAIENREFVVYYQPKITIDGKQLGGAEALCRWKRCGRIIPPLDFIPILETGMEICTLDFYVLDMVCRDVRRWMDEGKPVVCISVNFSRRHMADVQLLEHIIEIVDRHHVPHEYIEIELTETTTDVEFEDLKRVVAGLQREGFCTSVDDFGIGYSSLKLIKEVPWNILKIDRSFLPETDESTQSRRSVMFRHLIAMAQELGLKCISEGVETAEQVRLLCDNHCEMAQGFYFDKPLPVEEFEKRLDHSHYET